MSTLPGLTTKELGRDYRHFPTVGSTNDYLKENGAALPNGAAVTASVQTGAKGRRGKSWSQEPDRGLALSVLLHGWSAGEMSLLPLLAGVAVSQAVEDLAKVRCGLKWSNDVLVDAKKLCGILCESRIVGGGGFAVVGMGVNLHQTAEEFTRLGLVYAASLFSATGKTVQAAAMAAAILNRLEPLLEEYRRNGFGPIRERYKRRCVTLGRPVRVLLDGGQRTGVALDIAADGALLCEIDGEIRPINAGEASVRGIYGYSE